VMHAGVVPPGIIGFVLSGILPLLGDAHPWRAFTVPREAHRFLWPEGGDGLYEELRAIVEDVRGLGPQLQALRQTLRAHAGDLSIAQVSRRIGVSPRSLQRLLAAEGTSFRDEQREARFAAACDLLLTTEQKVGVIASRLGITERALAAMFRAHGAGSPAEFRRARRP
jgi:AraC-like DNA-binding protein